MLLSRPAKASLVLLRTFVIRTKVCDVFTPDSPALDAHRHRDDE